jgi:hypothetical protein
MKKIICTILIIEVFLQTAGCYSEYSIYKEDLKDPGHNKIRVITRDKKEYKAEKNYWILKEDTLLLYALPSPLYGEQADPQKISLNSVDKVYMNKYDVGKTAGLLVLIGVFTLALTVLVISNMDFQTQFNNMNWR